MKYDSAAKILMQYGGLSLLRRFLTYRLERIEELPNETITVRRSDAPHKMVLDDGSERVALVEHQTNWEAGLPLRLLEYRTRYDIKYGIPVDTIVFLIRPLPFALFCLCIHEVAFRFRLIKFWELEAYDFFDDDLNILTLLPLMKNGLNYVDYAQERIILDSRSVEERSNLLTALAIFTAVYDDQLSRALEERMEKLMEESPMYQRLLRKGLTRGIEQGLEQGIEQGLEQGREQGLEQGREQGKLESELAIARRMQAEGLERALILRVTGLSQEQLRECGI